MPTHCEREFIDGVECGSVMNDHLALHHNGNAICPQCLREVLEAENEKLKSIIATLPKRFRKRFES